MCDRTLSGSLSIDDLRPMPIPYARGRASGRGFGNLSSIADLLRARPRYAVDRRPASRDVLAALLQGGHQHAAGQRFDQLAHSCVAALRDVYGTSAPGQLSYTAWREPEVMRSGRTYTDEEISSLDAGRNPLPVESLTIPMTRR